MNQNAYRYIFKRALQFLTRQTRDEHSTMENETENKKYFEKSADLSRAINLLRETLINCFTATSIHVEFADLVGSRLTNLVRS